MIKLEISGKVAVIFSIGVRHVSDTRIKGGVGQKGSWRVGWRGDMVTV